PTTTPTPPVTTPTPTTTPTLPVTTPTPTTTPTPPVTTPTPTTTPTPPVTTPTPTTTTTPTTSTSTTFTTTIPTTTSCSSEPPLVFCPECGGGENLCDDTVRVCFDVQRTADSEPDVDVLLFLNFSQVFDPSIEKP
ncbi:unnamed protein product, partial [Meganyctiphanes norvegica]